MRAKDPWAFVKPNDIVYEGKKKMTTVKPMKKTPHIANSFRNLCSLKAGVSRLILRSLSSGRNLLIKHVAGIRTPS